MDIHYKMNQSTSDISTLFIPKEDHVVCFINDLVKSLQVLDSYIFGRPREYDLDSLLKLILFAYTH